MSNVRLVITAGVVEGRSHSEVARAYGISQPWVSRLVARYRAEGDAALEPRFRRAHSSPTATRPEVVELVLRLRKQLIEQGLDAGAHTICWHLHQHHQVAVSAATVWRIQSRHGQIAPEPKKRPKSSYTRFEVELPHQMWQTDVTHFRLTNGRDVEILNFLDDHFHYLLACVAYPRVTGPAVVAVFRETIARATTSPSANHPAPTSTNPEPSEGSGVCQCLETSHGAPGRIRTCAPASGSR